MRTSHWNTDDFSEAMGRVNDLVDDLVDDDTNEFRSVDPTVDIISARSALATAEIILNSMRYDEPAEFVEIADEYIASVESYLSALDAELAAKRGVDATGSRMVELYLSFLDQVMAGLAEFNDRIDGMTFDEARARVKEMKPAVKSIKKQWSNIELILTDEEDLKYVKKRVKYVKKMFALCEEYRDAVRP